MTKAAEASGHYKGEDWNPPDENAVQKSTEARTPAEEVVESIANQVLQYLLMEEARRPWCKILREQIDCSPMA